ncbi:NAD-dependent epimerase/dehydratase family protein [Prosthecomicrobium sp. N25]|uniref:NAD-dependent epimerase/dehydratase family protein n=1 Tax=Prosthecomicrobium sp. N25 TaxID=3129254 RepID=UPI003077DEC1
MARILITGAGGFVGSHLAAACVRRGDDVHVLLRASTGLGRLEPILDRITVHRLDLGAEPDLVRCLAAIGPDGIYHLASATRRREDPDLGDAAASVADDVLPLLGLVRAAALAPRPPAFLVRAGTLAEYGPVAVPYREDRREAPAGVYGASMLAATHLLAALQPRLPFPVATARLALVYGPGQSPEFLIPRMIRDCLDRIPVTIRHPMDRRDLIHVDDAVAGLLALGDAGLPGPVLVNLCSGVAPTMRAVAETLRRIMGAPDSAFLWGADGSASPVPNLRGSPARARRLLGWRCGIGLTRGLEATVLAFTAERAAPDPSRAPATR